MEFYVIALLSFVAGAVLGVVLAALLAFIADAEAGIDADERYRKGGGK